MWLASQNKYNAAHPIVRQVLKMMILGIPLAVKPLLQLATAQAGTCNSQKNITKPRRTWMGRIVLTWAPESVAAI